MKKIIILGLATAVIGLTSFSVAAAASDDQFPAANFQPKVIYLDQDAVKPSSDKCKGEKIAENKVEFDPQYPAANFQPKIIYPD
ncbi:MAG: hypothetical protein Q7U38_13430 [Methylobacter sp.]|nr:hypothetical protein [Methylobacter sp.]MDP2099364.1 hypothetical protein [Methylobacter sp.]MDP2427300.1 hypothetical protein [Methylobacter sp.]MDP3054879.1 hypothetical protein [Methylobacter sp.]MDP3364099.1 hypothetical protein [Methylobacter sp.]